MKKLCVFALLSALSIPALASVPVIASHSSTNSIAGDHSTISTSLGDKPWNPGGF